MGKNFHHWKLSPLEDTPIQNNLLFFKGFQRYEKKRMLLQKWLITKDMNVILQEAIARESTLDIIKMWNQAKPTEGKGNQNQESAVGGKKVNQSVGQQKQQQQQNQQQPQQELSKTQA